MNQPPKRIDMRESMPETTEWVEEKRRALGKDHVNECIRRGMRGEPGFFYAFERGHVLGTPFAAGQAGHDLQGWAVLHGCGFAGFIRESALSAAASVQTSARGVRP